MNREQRQQVQQQPKTREDLAVPGKLADRSCEAAIIRPAAGGEKFLCRYRIVDIDTALACLRIASIDRFLETLHAEFVMQCPGFQRVVDARCYAVGGIAD